MRKEDIRPGDVVLIKATVMDYSNGNARNYSFVVRPRSTRKLLRLHHADIVKKVNQEG
jgi:hypothetical protein